MKELTTQGKQELSFTSFKQYYGYVFTVEKVKLDRYREENQIKHDDFIEIMVSLPEEKRIIRLSYSEFKRRLFD